MNLLNCASKVHFIIASLLFDTYIVKSHLVQSKSTVWRKYEKARREIFSNWFAFRNLK